MVHPQQSHGKQDRCEVLRLLWQNSVDSSSHKEALKPETLRMKTFIRERQGPLEGMQR